LSEIEADIAGVWNQGSRPFVDEAWRCYNAGAIRTSIAAIWTAVIADIIAKITHLADDGDPAAMMFADKIDQAQQQGLQREGVQAMQRVESALLDKALEFEFIDSIDKQSLERIQQDRNLCVHPSLRPFGETYSPPPAVARAHLAVALDVLLVHPPTQGLRMRQVYWDFTCATSFAATAAHIQSTFYDRVRSATRRSITNIAAKHALLELDPDGRLERIRYADRSAEVLCALALRDRDLVRREVVGLRERFRTVGSNVQRRALARLGDQDFFWDMLDGPLIEHLNALIGESPGSPEHEQLNEATASALALVAVDSVRLHLPALEEQLPQLPPIHLASVIAARPDPFFVPYIVNLLKRAMNWRFGEQVGRLLIAHAPMLTSDQLAEALRSWAHNVDCRSASEMPAAAVEVLHRTAHLGPQRFDLFRSFLDDVRLYSTGQDDYYTYPALKEALDRLA
jgi:hypothetical protein